MRRLGFGKTVVKRVGGSELDDEEVLLERRREKTLRMRRRRNRLARKLHVYLDKNCKTTDSILEYAKKRSKKIAEPPASNISQDDLNELKKIINSNDQGLNRLETMKRCLIYSIYPGALDKYDIPYLEQVVYNWSQREEEDQEEEDSDLDY